MSARHNSTAASDALDSDASAVDQDRWRMLFDDYVYDLYRFLYMWTGNREDAEQLTSRVCLEVVRTLSSADASAAPEATRQWLFQVARRVLAEHLRAFYHLSKETLSDTLIIGWGTATSGADSAVGNTVEERVALVLDRLPIREREVLTYRFLLKRSLNETAALLGLSVQETIQVQYRALCDASQIAQENVSCAAISSTN